MARKLDNQDGPARPGGASALNILDWDEGCLFPNGPARVHITYRQERLRPEPERARAVVRVLIDPGNPPPKVDH